MSRLHDSAAEFDRYLLVDDTDEDVTTLLTVIAESTRCSLASASGDGLFEGGAQ
jgi:hypothetical protein